MNCEHCHGCMYCGADCVCDDPQAKVTCDYHRNNHRKVGGPTIPSITVGEVANQGCRSPRRTVSVGRSGASADEFKHTRSSQKGEGHGG